MTEHILTPGPLTAEAFAPFGEVIEVVDQTTIMINDGNTERYDSLAKIDCVGENDVAVINIFRAKPRELPMRIRMMEKHPLGSQSFHPLSGEPYLVLVANPVEHPEPKDLQLFLAQANQGINYRANTWHHPILSLNKVCDFLVVDRKGEGQNCDEFYFDDDMIIEIQL